MTSWRGAPFPRGERGFADDPYWYDLHVAADPRYGAALQEVVRAAPPVEPGAAVADLGAGTVRWRCGTRRLTRGRACT